MGGLKEGPGILVRLELTERLCVRVIELVSQLVTLIDAVVVGQEVCVLEPAAVVVSVLLIRGLDVRSKESVIVFDTRVVLDCNLVDDGDDDDKRVLEAIDVRVNVPDAVLVLVGCVELVVVLDTIAEREYDEEDVDVFELFIETVPVVEAVLVFDGFNVDVVVEDDLIVLDEILVFEIEADELADLDARVEAEIVGLELLDLEGLELYVFVGDDDGVFDIRGVIVTVGVTK